MDQVHEKPEWADLKSLLQEVLQTQEAILRRLDALEDILRSSR